MEGDGPWNSGAADREAGLAAIRIKAKESHDRAVSELAAAVGCATDDSGIKAVLSSLGQAKVVVAKLIKETRDLQEQILRASNAKDSSCEDSAELARGAEMPEGNVDGVRSALRELRDLASGMIEAVRFAELRIKALKRDRLVVTISECTLQVEKDLSALERAVTGSPLKFTRREVGGLMEQVRQMQNRVEAMRAYLTGHEDQSGQK